MSHLPWIHEKYEEVGKEMLAWDREDDDKCDLTEDAAKMVIEESP